MGVAVWNEAPPLELSEEMKEGLAQQCSGTCLVCQRDIEQQQNQGLERIVPKRSYRNVMDPCWNFPRKQLEWLFKQATVTEACLVALD